MAEQTEQTVTEKPAVSVEDKILNLFDGPDEQPEEVAEQGLDVQAEESEDAGESEVSEESEGGSEFVEVEFDGVSYQVPPELKDALMRTGDYTQKTQQLSHQRQEIELQQKELVLAREQAKFYESVQAEVDQLKMLDAYIQHVNHNTNWASLNGEEMFRTKMELDNLKEQKAQIEQQLKQKNAEFTQEVEKKRASIKAEVDSNLKKAIPGWNEKVKTEVQNYVKQLGYPELGADNMNSLDFQVAWKAMQFDQLKAKTKDAVKTASAAPAIKPTARKEMPKAVQNKLNYRKAIQKAPDSKTRSKLAEERLADIFS